MVYSNWKFLSNNEPNKYYLQVSEEPKKEMKN